MARYEIVGRSDCPWYAKAEKLSEDLQAQFSNIEFNKTMKDENQWKVGLNTYDWLIALIIDSNFIILGFCGENEEIERLGH